MKQQKKTEYETKLFSMSDEALFDETKSKIWLSAYAFNNPRSDFHWQCDRCYDEAKRRGNLKIYSDAFAAARR